VSTRRYNADAATPSTVAGPRGPWSTGRIALLPEANIPPP